MSMPSNPDTGRYFIMIYVSFMFSLSVISWGIALTLYIVQTYKESNQSDVKIIDKTSPQKKQFTKKELLKTRHPKIIKDISYLSDVVNVEEYFLEKKPLRRSERIREKNPLRRSERIRAKNMKSKNK